LITPCVSLWLPQKIFLPHFWPTPLG
jgi:hypothetical protein